MGAARAAAPAARALGPPDHRAAAADREGLDMPATTIYFAQLDPTWNDWVQIVNVGNGPAKVVCIARDAEAKVVWTAENTLSVFQAWVPAVDTPKVSTSFQVNSDQPIVGERHCHQGTQVLDFPGASLFGKTVGKRLFFPELASGAYDWFRFLNVGDADAHISFIVRDINSARVIVQRSHVVGPLRWWDLADTDTGASVQGTVEVVSTQPVVAERHLHYKGGQVAVGQLGQVLDQ
jgi:hypothetical protein